MNGKILSISIERVNDQDPDPSYLEQEGFEDRLAQYKNGDFYFIGIRAKATLEILGTIQTIRTPGLWGIEDDSGEDYLESVANEEKENLKDILIQMGFLPEYVNEQIQIMVKE
jgi:hypothetical protein